MKYKSPTIGLSLTGPDSGQTLFLDWRDKMSGNDEGSNMMLIDDAIKNTRENIAETNFELKAAMEESNKKIAEGLSHNNIFSLTFEDQEGLLCSGEIKEGMVVL